MLNLIPNQEKKKKVKDFYFRLIVVAFFVLAFCILLAILTAAPAYILSASKRNLAENRLQELTGGVLPTLDENLETNIAQINQKMALIEKARKDKYLISQKIINEISARKLPGMKIYQISYEEGVDGKKAEVRGVAGSREELLNFRRALESDSAFQKVELPISNFIKGTDIEFYLTLIPA